MEQGHIPLTGLLALLQTKPYSTGPSAEISWARGAWARRSKLLHGFFVPGKNSYRTGSPLTLALLAGKPGRPG